MTGMGTDAVEKDSCSALRAASRQASLSTCRLLLVGSSLQEHCQP